MTHRTLVPALLALLLAAPALHAQTPASKAATTNAVDPASIQALKDMGAHLRTLKRYRITTELTGERVLLDGQKLQHTAMADIDVSSPNMLHARMVSPRSERVIFYDGKQATLYTPAQKYYSTVPFSDTVSALVHQMEDKYAVEFPLSDLFIWGTPAAPLDKIESAMNAGQDFVGGDLCDHYAFRQGAYDWQIWITAGSQPLPRKLVITNRDDDARPQSVSLIDWDLNPGFRDSTFRFTPPKGATAVKLHSPANK